MISLFGKSNRPATLPMRSYQYQFEANIQRMKYGRMFYGGVFLPEAILSIFPKASERGFRLVGEVGGLFSEFGVMAFKTRRYIVLSQGFLAQAKLKTGDLVMFRFTPIDPNSIEISMELEQALQSNRAAAVVWGNLTVGKKREYSNRVSSGAREETRLRRAYEIIDDLVNLNFILK